MTQEPFYTPYEANHRGEHRWTPISRAEVWRQLELLTADHNSSRLAVYANQLEVGRLIITPTMTIRMKRS